MTKIISRTALLPVLAALALNVVVQDAALADPPDWAPAHGWRDKHERDDDRHEGNGRYRDDRGRDDRDADARNQRWEREHRHTRYSDYDGHRWPSDYGIVLGECDRHAIGAVLGGVVGGAVGSRASGEDRPVAILVGSVIGAVLGAEIGRRMDEEDRACMGHSLELADGGRPVMWSNQGAQTTYILTPLDKFQRGDQPCRDFTFEVRTAGRKDLSNQRACRSGAGRWDLVGR